MDEAEALAARFEARRAHLHAVALRMLGSAAEAEDAVQEVWLRVSRADSSEVRNLDGWLTTIAARICLDLLRSRKARREEPLDAAGSPADRDGDDPERDALLGDAVGLALTIVLDTLKPPERVAFVLHDMFDVPFDDIASIIDRTPEATRQLASRARRRVRGANALGAADLRRRQQLVAAFLAAARGGDLQALIAILDPAVVARADGAAIELGADAEIRGVEAVAGTFAGRARAARTALLDGVPGLVWAPGGQPRVAFAFTVGSRGIRLIELIADPRRLGEMDIAFT